VEIGKKGGDRVKATRGPNFYEEIGRKGGQTVKKLIEEGKRAAKEAAAKEAHAKEQSSEAPVQSAERADQ
jgi:general stress protein YciG